MEICMAGRTLQLYVVSRCTGVQHMSDHCIITVSIALSLAGSAGGSGLGSDTHIYTGWLIQC
jgi:hypothetical protein